MWTNIPPELQKQLDDKWVKFKEGYFNGGRGYVVYELLGYSYEERMRIDGTPTEIIAQLTEWIKTYEKPEHPIGGYVDLGRVGVRDEREGN